jgi:serine/threonine-protein kinase
MPKVLADRYEVGELIGTGGMAEVYGGRDRLLNRAVAIKVLLPHFSRDPQFLARFRREAQAAANLTHPNIVAVYDTGHRGDVHYIVMEFMEGHTLRDVLRSEGPLLPERAAEIAADVAAALAFAHQRGVVHRDIKPGNVMLTPDGGVKVMDFGIARAVSAETVTQTASVVGTANYISPEQAQAAPVDARSDIYSLGIVVYEMLTGRVPFTGPSPVAIAYKHVREEAAPPSRLNSDVTGTMDAVVLKAIAKNPANRYSTALEFTADLERAVRGLPVQSTPLLASDQTTIVSGAGEETVVVGPLPLGSQDRRRRALGYALLALGIVCALGVVIVLLAGNLSSTANRISVPDVVGLPQSEAETALQAKGLAVRIRNVNDDRIPKDTVVGQDPEANTKIKRGATVTLKVSIGPGLVEVPDLIGLTEAEATAKLESAGLAKGEVDTAPSDTVQAGKVMYQSPRKGFKAEVHSPVDLVVSSGRAMRTVPSVIGLTEAKARRMIEGDGFVYQSIGEPQSTTCDQPAGRVCRQDPPDGSDAEAGSTVTVVVSRGPMGGPTSTTTPAPTPSETPTL